MIKRYQTTTPIKSLESNGVNVAAGRLVTPAAFAPERWQALLDEGAVVEIVSLKPIGDMTIDELKAFADERGVAYTWNIKAETLRERLRDA